MSGFRFQSANCHQSNTVHIKQKQVKTCNVESMGSIFEFDQCFMKVKPQTIGFQKKQI